MRHCCWAIVLAATGFLIGCHGTTGTTPSAAAPPAAPSTPRAAAPAAAQARVSDRPGNVNGRVFVAMYHHLGERKDPMFRTTAQFTGDLKRLDRLGFRPVTASDYLSGRMNLAPGASPVVMTFDDSNPDQVRFLTDGSLDPTCMLGLWAAFAKTHPEFPIRATFFILPDTLFGQPKWRAKKIELLRSLGCELANHTIHHWILRKRSDAEVESEIGLASEDLAKLGQPLPTPLALPFGSSPRNRALLDGFDWQGKRVTLTGVFLVGSNPAPSTSDPKFDRTRIPRIQANEGEYGLTYWLDQFERGKVRVYVQP